MKIVCQGRYKTRSQAGGQTQFSASLVQMLSCRQLREDQAFDYIDGLLKVHFLELELALWRGR